MRTSRFLATEAVIGVGVWLAIPSLVSVLFIVIAVAAGIALFKAAVFALVPFGVYLAIRPRKCRRCKRTVKTSFCSGCGTEV
jgi:uncharacterized membrane protein YccF (DUF307 family)